MKLKALKSHDTVTLCFGRDDTKIVNEYAPNEGGKDQAKTCSARISLYQPIVLLFEKLDISFADRFHV
jgi:hypothetical protein